VDQAVVMAGQHGPGGNDGQEDGAIPGRGGDDDGGSRGDGGVVTMTE
jgi:hypothetical protein